MSVAVWGDAGGSADDVAAEAAAEAAATAARRLSVGVMGMVCALLAASVALAFTSRGIIAGVTERGAGWRGCKKAGEKEKKKDDSLD